MIYIIESVFSAYPWPLAGLTWWESGKLAQGLIFNVNTKENKITQVT